MVLYVLHINTILSMTSPLNQNLYPGIIKSTFLAEDSLLFITMDFLFLLFEVIKMNLEKWSIFDSLRSAPRATGLLGP